MTTGALETDRWSCSPGRSGSIPPGSRPGPGGPAATRDLQAQVGHLLDDDRGGGESRGHEAAGAARPRAQSDGSLARPRPPERRGAHRDGRLPRARIARPPPRVHAEAGDRRRPRAVPDGRDHPAGADSAACPGAPLPRDLRDPARLAARGPQGDRRDDHGRQRPGRRGARGRRRPALGPSTPYDGPAQGPGARHGRADRRRGGGDLLPGDAAVFAPGRRDVGAARDEEHRAADRRPDPHLRALRPRRAGAAPRWSSGRSPCCRSRPCWSSPCGIPGRWQWLGVASLDHAASPISASTR